MCLNRGMGITLHTTTVSYQKRSWGGWSVLYGGQMLGWCVQRGEGRSGWDGYLKYPGEIEGRRVAVMPTRAETGFAIFEVAQQRGLLPN